MYSEENLNRRAVYLAKDAFKSWLGAQIGEISKKPSVETQAWILALEEIRIQLQSHLIRLPDGNSLVLNPEKFNALGFSEKL